MMVKRNTAEALWASLEKAGEVPDAQAIRYLSGLLDEGIKRLAACWHGLPLETRRGLSRALVDIAEADFEMDFSAVFQIALDDVDAATRATAIEGLYESEDVRLVPRFSQILREDGAAKVRERAAQALARFVLLGELGKIRPRPFEMARASLWAAYNDAEEPLDVRRRALESLAYTGLDGVAGIIQKAYQQPEERWRKSAVFAMGRSADARWADIVSRELHSVLPEMRYEAARACGELGLPQAASSLIELVEDVDGEVRQMALWALGQIGGRQAQKTLSQYVDSDNEALRVAARAALDELEFFHGDLASFFGPPPDFDGESDTDWMDDLHLGDFAEEDEDEEPW